MSGTSHMTKEQVKTISPKLSKNPDWAGYVESSWFRFSNIGIDWQSVALGFEAAARPAGTWAPA